MAYMKKEIQPAVRDRNDYHIISFLILFHQRNESEKLKLKKYEKN